MNKIIIKRTKTNYINCCIEDENGKEYSIGFNNDIHLIHKSIKAATNADFYQNILFNAFDNNFFYNFQTNMRQRAHIDDIFCIKFFYKLMWSKLYEMLFISYKYYDSINLLYLPSNYVLLCPLSFYIIGFLERYFDYKIDDKIKQWIFYYCDNRLEVNNMSKKTFDWSRLDKEEKTMEKDKNELNIKFMTARDHNGTIKYLGMSNPYENLFNKIQDYNILSRIKLTKDKKENKCYMVVIWADKTITKVSLPVKTTEFDFKSSNNINLLTLTLHKNPDLKYIWDDKDKTKFLFNSFLICFLKRHYSTIKLNNLLECIDGYDKIKNFIITNNKIFNVLSIITKMNYKNLYKIFYKIFFA